MSTAVGALPCCAALPCHRHWGAFTVRYLVDVVLLRVPDGGEVQDVCVELGGHVIDIHEALGHADVLVHRPAVPCCNSAEASLCCVLFAV